MIAVAGSEPIPTGTSVLNINDGELGSIMNGFSFGPGIGWYEYEVEIKDGIERWLRSDFVLMSELDEDAQ